MRVSGVAAAPVVALLADDTLEDVRAWMATHAVGSAHQGFPVVDSEDRLVGVITRRDVFDGGATAASLRGVVKRSPAVVFDDSSLRDAIDHMAREKVGRLPVVSREEPDRVIGMITRSDLIAAHGRRLDGERLREPHFRFGRRPAPPDLQGSRAHRK
jgi:chloride channel protein, CIC family